MTTLFGVGESIEGEKIYYRFGGAKPKGDRIDLYMNGYAVVMQRYEMKPANPPTPADRLECNSGKGTAREVTREKKQVWTSKNHKGWEGMLRGNARVFQAHREPHRSHKSPLLVLQLRPKAPDAQDDSSRCRRTRG